MDALAITVESWEPQRRFVARLLAMGYSQSEAARQVPATLRTIQRWCRDPAYDAYVQRLHEVAWERIEPKVAANLELALELQRKVFTGDLEPSDGHYREARRFIDRMVDKIFYLEPTPAAADRHGPPITNNILVQGVNGASPDDGT